VLEALIALLINVHNVNLFLTFAFANDWNVAASNSVNNDCTTVRNGGNT